MKVRDLSVREIAGRMAGAGMIVSFGRFRFRCRSRLPRMGEILHSMYAEAEAPGPDTIVDFTIAVEAAGRRHGLYGDALANFLIDGVSIREPFLRSLAWPYLEWATNYAFGTRSYHLLLVHAAVVERNGRAIALPGRPGAGKSTLTAALVLRGWRFLSDEFMIVEPATGDLLPFPRPISLKEKSIEVVSALAPGAVFSPMFEGTHKGTVTYLKVPDESVARASEPARLAHVVYPLYEADSGLLLEPKSKARAFLEMADNSFNYQVRGERGFDDLRRIFEPVSCYDLTYSDLDAAIVALEGLT